MEVMEDNIADEILSIIARRTPHLSVEKLCQEFENKTGIILDDFVETEGHTFVCSSPLLSFQELAVFRSASEYQRVSQGYRICAKKTSRLEFADDDYREMLLVQVCKLIHTNSLTNAICDNTGNSVLHYVIGIPGESTPELVRGFLKALAENDDLVCKTNKKGQNILQIVAGRMRAEKNDNGDLVFGSKKTVWAAKDRKAIVEVLNEELESIDLIILATGLDEFGDTPMHEWALSTSTRRDRHTDSFLAEDETEIASLLLEFGAQLDTPNDSGHIPLHYAFNTNAFEFLIQQCDLRDERNDLDETPLMFMIKTIIRNFLSQTCVDKYPELSTEFLKTVSPKPIHVNSLMHVNELVRMSTINDTVRDIAWLPDVCGNSIFNIVLLGIKITSYDFSDAELDTLQHLRKLNALVVFKRELVSLLKTIIPVSSNAEGQQNMRNPLHTLLSIRPNIRGLRCMKTGIIESLDVLLQHGVEVNTVDTLGRTPLDIVYTMGHTQPRFFTEIISKLRQRGARRSAQSFQRELRSRCSKRHLQNATDLVTAAQEDDSLTVVGKYRYFNDQPIGSGAFSSVFLAIKDEQTDEQSGTIHCSVFALKRVEKTRVNPKEITREVKALMSLSNDNENIVRYYGVEDSQDKFFQYICLELMDGDLNEFVTNNDVNKVMEDPVIRLQATKQIINGLAFLHEKNFIHRDLKPGNILYSATPKLRFKIADFGLAKNTFSFTSNRGCAAMAPGTRCWMAPELISSRSGDHTQQSDIFSLGLVLHYLLTVGKHACATENEELPPYIIEQRIANLQIPFNQVHHPEAVSFLQQLLNKNPLKRVPAKFLQGHPFLWSMRKKIEFLKAVGDQPEVVCPDKNSRIEQCLQKTTTGKEISVVPWSRCCSELYQSMKTSKRRTKIRRTYRNTVMIDFLRFIRNAYCHKEERSSRDKSTLNNNVFLRAYPSLVLDVLAVVQQLWNDEDRSSIRQALSMECEK